MWRERAGDTEVVISFELAARLRDAGLTWRPQPADQFTIPQPELAGQVFTLSEMTIEAHEYPTGTVLGFNGTTEWALDSVTLDQALWLPREDQLRGLLGATFQRLEAEGEAFRVSISRPGHPASEQHTDSITATDAADAYALALLVLIAHSKD